MIVVVRRLIVWLLAVSAALILYTRGHGTLRPGVYPVASFRAAPSSLRTIRVKLEGIPSKSGIYELPAGGTVETVIIMALKRIPSSMMSKPVLTQRLCDGNLVKVLGDISEHPELVVEIVSVRERMVLGIPLNPSMLSEREWELLPGIGPALARRIVADRQRNGGFRSCQDLLRVPGIGPSTLEKIASYF